MHPRRFLLIPLVLYSLSLTACAQSNGQGQNDVIQTDRPDFTVGTSTVSKGRFQVEGGVTVTRQGPERTYTFGEVDLRLGTSHRSELRLGLPSSIHLRDTGQHDSRADDGSLGFRYRFKPVRPFQALAVTAETALPFGSGQVVQNRYEPQVVLAGQLPDLGEYSLTANLGYGRLLNPGDRFNQGWLSLELSKDPKLDARLGHYIEFYAFNKEQEDGPSHRFISGGLMYLLNNDSQIDARLGFGLNNGANGPDFFYGAGYSRRF